MFYWDFLIRHHRRFKTNRRMAMVLKNVERLDSKEKRAIRDRARALRRKLGMKLIRDADLGEGAVDVQGDGDLAAGG